MNRILFFTVALSLFNNFSCKSSQKNSSAMKGVDIDSKSLSIESALKKQDITSIRILPNTKTPKAVMMTLNEVTLKTFTNLYQFIYQINLNEHLTGLSGPNQEITLIGVASKSEIVQQFQSDIKQRIPNLPSGKTPYFQNIFATVDLDIWMQDWGEIAGTKLKNGNWSHLILDTGRGFINGDRDVSVFSDTLGIPFLRAPAEGAKSAGNFGGNLEATPEGTFYHGETMDTELLNAIVSRDNKNHITLPTLWLQTQHVDEYLSFIPSTISSCKSALVYASPLLGLQLLAKSQSQDVAGTQLPNPTSIQDSLKYFSQTASATSTAWTGYNLKKKERASNYEMDSFVLNQLKIEQIILEAIQTLKKNRVCLDQTVALPQLFVKDTSDIDGAATSPILDEEANAEAEKFMRFTSLLANPVNMLVLRNHAFVAIQKASDTTNEFKPFSKYISNQLERHLSDQSSNNHVHFIDGSIYQMRGGGIHCGTNVIRELN